MPDRTSRTSEQPLSAKRGRTDAIAPFWGRNRTWPGQGVDLLTVIPSGVTVGQLTV